MNKLEKVKIEISMLEDDKENLKFGYSQILVAYLGVLALLTTIFITLLTAYNEINDKITGLILLLAMIGLTSVIFIPALKMRAKRLEVIAKEIKERYLKIKS